MDVRIHKKMSRLFENVVRRECFVDMWPTFCHKMAAGNNVVNRDNFRVALVVTSATFNYVHASY